MKRNTKIDYYEQDISNRKTNLREEELESLSEIYDHLEEMKVNPPKSKAGIKKLEYYKRKMEKYE